MKRSRLVRLFQALRGTYRTWAVPLTGRAHFREGIGEQKIFFTK